MLRSGAVARPPSGLVTVTVRDPRAVVAGTETVAWMVLASRTVTLDTSTQLLTAMPAPAWKPLPDRFTVWVLPRTRWFGLADTSAGPVLTEKQVEQEPLPPSGLVTVTV